MNQLARVLLPPANRVSSSVCDMAKDKQPKPKGVPNKHLHARTTFLYQAATYLTLRAGEPSGLALQLASDLHAVSRKGQVRLSSELKRSVCKTCYAVLIPGRTATQTLENESKQGKKPWADVLVLACTVCGTKKRFPVGAKRPKKKSERTCGLPAPRMSEKSSDGHHSAVSNSQPTPDQESSLM